MGAYNKAGLILGLVLFLIILLFVNIDPSNSSTNTMAAIAVLMAVWWITEAIPLAVTSLVPLILFPFFGLLPAEEIASSYINSVIFLFLGGFLIAIAMEEWNLHKRIAFKIISVFGGSPNSIVFGFMLASCLLSMWISNTATALMMLPIALAIISNLETEFGEQKIQNFSLILLLSVAYSCSLGGIATIVGTPPNIAFIKIINILFPDSPQIGFGDWMMLAVPISIIMLTATYLLLTKVFYKVDEQIRLDKKFVSEEYNKLGKISFEEKIISIVFCCTALLWIFRTDLNLGIFIIPGWANLISSSDFVNDGTVAITMATLLFIIPSKRKSTALLDHSAFKKVPWAIILLFGGGFALANGFTSSGLTEFIGKNLSGVSHLSPFLIVIITAAMMTFLTEFTSNTASTQMVLPLLASVSVVIGVNPLLMMLTATLSASMAFMLPVATPPNTIIFASGKVRIPQMAKTGFFINLLGIIVISLVVYFLGDALFSLSLFPDWAISK